MVSQIGISGVEAVWVADHNGYKLRRGEKPFGFVRFNIAGRNQGKFTVYSYRHDRSDDPDNRFKSTGSKNSRFQLHTTAWPDDEESIHYALSVLRASCGRT